MDLDYFLKIWTDKDDGPKPPGWDKRAWDKRAEEFNSHESDERLDKVTELLASKELLKNDSIVLDIGCGPGKFALAFARKAKYVVGVDISPRMIQFAEENAAAAGQKNVEFREIDWRKADLADLQWKNKFSLVTAIMSPALSSRENLDKMIEATSGSGFLCHFMERNDSVYDALKPIADIRSRADDYGNRALYCSFNILWHYKLYPEIAYFHTERQDIRPLKEAEKHYLNRLEAKTELTGEQRAKVRDFLSLRQENGFIKEEITAKVACVFWRNK